MARHFAFTSDSATPALATVAAAAPSDADAAADLLRAARPQIDATLLERGAILFRGLPLRTATDFGKAVAAFGGVPMNYVGGTVPRTRVGPGVFTSTELDRRFRIQLHNELAYQPHYPDRLAFFCERPAHRGGQTTLADCRAVLERIEPRTRAKFEALGVRYVRVFQKYVEIRERFKTRFPLYYHPTWRLAFGSDSEADVERQCRALSVTHQWRGNGDLEVMNVAPATVHHPQTGEQVWFNHANNLHFNPQTLGRLVYGWRKIMYRSESDHPNQVYFGSGESITRGEINAVHAALDASIVNIDWHVGDLLLVDNRLVAHGRAPYVGDRRVLVSLLAKADGGSADTATTTSKS